MNKKLKNTLLCVLIGFVIGLSGLLYGFYNQLNPVNLFHYFELKTINMRYNLLYPTKEFFKLTNKAEVIVVEVDDEFITTQENIRESKDIPRKTYADLIEELNKLNVKTIGIDIMFLRNINPDSEDNIDLINAISKHKNVILSSQITRYDNTEGYSLKTSFDDYFPENYYGIVSIYPDIDGFVRKFQYSYYRKRFNFKTFKEEEVFTPTFATAIINNYDPDLLNKKLISTENKDNKYISFIEFATKRNHVPLYTFFSDNKKDAIKKEDFENKIVLVGPTYKLFKDFFNVPLRNKQATPFSPDAYSIPGVEIHANVIDSILNNNIIKDFNYNLNLIITILLCVLLSFILSNSRTFIHSLVAVILMVLIYFAFSLIVYLFFNRFTMLALPEAQILLTGACCWAYSYFAVNKDRNYIYNSFSKYVSPEVARIAAEKIEDLEGKKQIVTILFSDIADFTTISEQLDPAKLSYMLNTYLSRMVDILFKNDGTLDKYIGDAIMAFWGAPISIDKPELKACVTALEMLKEIEKLNQEFNQENLPALKIRIGINTSEVVVGNLGGKLFNYTAIGDGVNLTSRLEGANKVFNSSILISENTYLNIKNDLLCKELGKIQVKGKTESVLIFELLNIKNNQNTQLEKDLMLYNQALDNYKSKNWDEALKLFNIYLEKQPQDYITMNYINKIEHYKINPPDTNWNDVLELKNK